MNIADLRKGERRQESRRAQDKEDVLPTESVVDPEGEELRSGEDRRKTDRRHLTPVEGADESYVRVPINPEIQNLLLDMYSDDLEQQ